MHGGGSAPSSCAFTHRVAFEEGSGPRVLLKSGPGNRGRSACGTTHVARLEFPHETDLILRCAGKAGNPFQTTQWNRLSCRDQEGRRGSEDAVPGPSVFTSGVPTAAGNAPGAHLGRGKPGLRGSRFRWLWVGVRSQLGTTWFFSSCGGILVLRRGITGFLLCRPWVAQSSILVASESWGLRSSQIGRAHV